MNNHRLHILKSLRQNQKSKELVLPKIDKSEYEYYVDIRKNEKL